MTMLRDLSPGRWVLAIACLALGALTFFYRDFALQWQPIPATVPLHQGIVYLSGAVLLFCAIGLMLAPIEDMARKALILNFAIFWFLPQLVQLTPSWRSVGPWLGPCEALGALCGAIALRRLRPDGAKAGLQSAISRAVVRVFGVCCVIYGISHLQYADFTASMIPDWLPWHRPLAYLTGSIHILAGCALILDLRPKLAASIEAAMMSSFVALLHMPSLWATPAPAWAPSPRIQLTALFWAMTLTGAAWCIAELLRSAALVAPSADERKIPR
jgi:uncharacterized membrane protein